MRTIEYSRIVRNKLLKLRSDLAEKYDEALSKRVIGKMMQTVRRLENYPESGVRVAELYEIETDYYYIFTEHNYFVYRIENDKVIVVQMFHEREDFMDKLFGEKQ